MPYIAKDLRDEVDPSINVLVGAIENKDVVEKAGIFTYIVYKLLLTFTGRFWVRALGIGCLVCAILEIYRREHAPYEDWARSRAGDV